MRLVFVIDSGLVGSTTLGGVPRERKMLKGHLPRVMNHQLSVYEGQRSDQSSVICAQTDADFSLCLTRVDTSFSKVDRVAVRSWELTSGLAILIRPNRVRQRSEATHKASVN